MRRSDATSGLTANPAMGRAFDFTALTEVDDTVREEILEELKPEAVARDVLLEACDACPVDALTVWDSSGAQIVPS